MKQPNGAALDVAYEPIQPHLARLEEILSEELASTNPFVRDIIRHASRFHGKRIRPALLLLSARIFGNVSDLHVGLAAVVEMVHNATLAHDDVLDGAEQRRHIPSLNSTWGNPAAVLFGDLLFAKAFTLCARLNCSEANLILSQTTQNVCEGELSQIANCNRFDLDEASYLNIVRLKTASLFSAACRLGGILAPPRSDAVEALARFGHHLGTAFQIVDDCLDVVGNEADAGKSLGTDLAQGKSTLPLILLLRSLPPPRRHGVERLLISRDGAAEIRKLLAEHGAVEAALERARALIAEAQVAIRSLPEDRRRPLVELAGAVVPPVLNAAGRKSCVARRTHP